MRCVRGCEVEQDQRGTDCYSGQLDVAVVDLVLQSPELGRGQGYGHVIPERRSQEVKLIRGPVRNKRKLSGREVYRFSRKSVLFGVEGRAWLSRSGVCGVVVDVCILWCNEERILGLVCAIICTFPTAVP